MFLNLIFWSPHKLITWCVFQGQVLTSMHYFHGEEVTIINNMSFSVHIYFYLLFNECIFPHTCKLQDICVPLLDVDIKISHIYKQ